MAKKALVDFHHTQLYQSFQHLFERELGIEVYRPLGREWAERGYFHHPIEEEMYGLLTEQSPFDPAKHKTVFDVPDGDGVLWKDKNQDCILFRWLPLERIHEIDYIVCTVYRNEDQFYRLKRDFGLKNVPILRYAGNGGESVDPNKFDILISALLEHHERYIKSGIKPGLLFHPWFQTNEGLFCYTPLPEYPPILRQFLNFSWHHREPGSPWETFQRYCGYCNEIGAKYYLHGLGTPPPGIEVPLDVIIDRSFREMGREDLLDRSKWPDLRYNQGEPPNLRMLATLIKLSHVILHPKNSPPEGFGFCAHEFAACGRPMIIPQWYKQLSASLFLQEKETCIFITGEDPIDKENFRYAVNSDNNARMAETIRKRFDENVNFAAEAEAIRKLL